MNKFAQVVSEYRAAQEKTLREFADVLSENLIDGISHSTIHNWEHGKPAGYSILISIMLKYDDWRKLFAIDGLAALVPDLYLPKGEIGIRILQPTPTEIEV